MATTENISCGLSPAASASAHDDDPSRRPTTTSMPVPSSESRRFCAWAGPCEPQPITPMRLMPAKASGSFGNRWRPPLTTVSLVPARSMVSTSKMLDFSAISVPQERADDEARGRAGAPARRVWTKASGANHSGQIGKFFGGSAGRGRLNWAHDLHQHGERAEGEQRGPGQHAVERRARRRSRRTRPSGPA